LREVASSAAAPVSWVAAVMYDSVSGQVTKDAFTSEQHVAGNMLLVAGNKIVASLLPVCCWIQRDTSRP